MVFVAGERTLPEYEAYLPYAEGGFIAVKRVVSLVLFLMLAVLSVSGFANDSPFVYEHDPRENPNAMRDIVVNPDAVYGFSPSSAAESTLKEYADAIDWTDPEQVAEAREKRQAYHDSMEELYAMTLSMAEQDLDIETIARAVSQRRNEIRLESGKDDPEELAMIKRRNLEIYGNEFGPDQDALYEKYGSWETVLLKALSTNSGMDACLGFYDEYYYLYELGEEMKTEDPDDDTSPEEEAEESGDMEGKPEDAPGSETVEDTEDGKDLEEGTEEQENEGGLMADNRSVARI